MSDYSCYVMIQNKSKWTLTMDGNADQGSWQVDFPMTVAPGATTGWVQLRDPSGPEGAAGGIDLSAEGTNASLSATFSDGYVSSNTCSIGSQGLTDTMTWTFAGGTGGPGGLEPDNVPGSGHPVYLEFTFTDSAA